MRRTFENTPLDSDFDFFFANKEQMEEFEDSLEQLGAVKRGSNDKNTVYKMPSGKIYLTADADDKTYVPELELQLIHFQYYANLEAVLESFDFTITQFGYDGTDLFASDFALWDLARKRLVPTKVNYATATVRRLLKYSNQGYTVCAGAISEILTQVAGDPKIIEPEVLYID